jgi:hypothetical protein
MKASVLQNVENDIPDNMAFIPDDSNLHSHSHRKSDLKIRGARYSREEHSPEETDLFAARVFLFEHRTGMDSCKKKFSVSGIRNEAVIFQTIFIKQLKLQSLN